MRAPFLLPRITGRVGALLTQMRERHPSEPEVIALDEGYREAQAGPGRKLRRTPDRAVEAGDGCPEWAGGSDVPGERRHTAPAVGNRSWTMNDRDPTIDPRQISVPAAAIVLAATAVALALLAALHVLSPEFSPAWRMVSEYANGRYPSALSAMFLAYGLSSLALAFAIRSQLETRSGRIGLAALVVSGAASAAAAVFDLDQLVLHELAGVVGIVALPIGAVLVSRTLARQPEWSGARRRLLWSAHLTWISVVLFIASFPLMMATFALALGALPSSPPSELPIGVVAIVGWTDRLLILSAWAWMSITAWHAIRVQRTAITSEAGHAPATPTGR